MVHADGYGTAAIIFDDFGGVWLVCQPHCDPASFSPALNAAQACGLEAASPVFYDSKLNLDVTPLKLDSRTGETA